MEVLALTVLGLLVGALGLQTHGKGGGAASGPATRGPATRGTAPRRRRHSADRIAARAKRERTWALDREMRNHLRRIESLTAFRDRARREGDEEAVELAERLLETEKSRHAAKLGHLDPR